MKPSLIGKNARSISIILGIGGMIFLPACAKGDKPAAPASEVGEKAMHLVTGDTFNISEAARSAKGIAVDEKTKRAMNVQSEPALRRQLIKRIHVPGRIARDEELYLVQQEYLSVQSLGEDLERSARSKLELMGLSDEAIGHLVHYGKADESLILPSVHRAWLFAEIYEKDIALIRPGFSVEIAFGSYPGRTFTGTVQAIELKLNPETRSAKARIIIEHPMIKLSVDMYADVAIKVPLGKKLSVPVGAIIDTGKRQLVYVETENNRYAPRIVRIGNETDEYAEVLEGLAEGERVATEGNFLLDSQATIGGGQVLLYGGAEQVKEETKPPVHQH